MGIPNENVPNFVVHLILAVLATAVWILLAPLVGEDFAIHIRAWVIFELSLGAVQMLYAMLAALIDSRESTFYERKSATFLFVDISLAVMNVATAVTGTIYWRDGGKERDNIFNTVVVFTWCTLLALGVIAAQDAIKMRDEE